jgi:hypothetical protein
MFCEYWFQKYGNHRILQQGYFHADHHPLYRQGLQTIWDSPKDIKMSIYIKSELNVNITNSSESNTSVKLEC